MTRDVTAVGDRLQPGYPGRAGHADHVDAKLPPPPGLKVAPRRP